MKYLGFLCGVAFAAIVHDAFAKNRLTAPVKISRECKSEVEQYYKDLRPGERGVPRRQVQPTRAPPGNPPRGPPPGPHPPGGASPGPPDPAPTR